MPTAFPWRYQYCAPSLANAGLQEESFFFLYLFLQFILILFPKTIIFFFFKLKIQSWSNNGVGFSLNCRCSCYSHKKCTNLFNNMQICSVVWLSLELPIFISNMEERMLKRERVYRLRLFIS